MRKTVPKYFTWGIGFKKGVNKSFILRLRKSFFNELTIFFQIKSWARWKRHITGLFWLLKVVQKIDNMHVYIISKLANIRRRTIKLYIFKQYISNPENGGGLVAGDFRVPAPLRLQEKYPRGTSYSFHLLPTLCLHWTKHTFKATRKSVENYRSYSTDKNRAPSRPPGEVPQGRGLWTSKFGSTLPTLNKAKVQSDTKIGRET
jgi:hypothetical protein